MKKLILFLVIVCLLSNIQAQEALFEEASYECLVDRINKHTPNLINDIKAYENYLIQKEFLQDSSSKSYKLFFTEMSKINATPATRSDVLFAKIVNTTESWKKEFFTTELLCVSEKLGLKGSINSLVSDSENWTYFRFMDARREVLANKMEFQKKFAEIILKEFKDRDYQKPLFKTILLIHIIIAANSEENLQFGKLPPPK